MPRAAPVSPVNAKMYRHFAIASLVITGALAMFANSERRQALGDNLSEQSPQHEAQAHNPKKTLNFTDNRTTKGSFGEEAGPGQTGRSMAFETRMDPSATGPELTAGDSIALIPQDTAILPDNAVNGLPPGMTEEEILEWRRRHQKRVLPAEPSEPTASEVAAMLAASKARSSTPGT